MSSSEEDSKIDLLDDAASVKKKLKRAFCEPGNIKENGLLSFVKHVIFPLNEGKAFEVNRKEDFGGNLSFDTFEALEEAFAKEDLHPGDLKGSVEIYLNRLLDPIRQEFRSPELQKLTRQAYPPPPKTKVKAAAGGASSNDEITPARLDLRVGKITSIKQHPDAESLYVEEVDLGGDTRTVVSGLVAHVPIEQLEGRLGVFLCNLKAVKMRGIESQAMLLCASQSEPAMVEPLDVPEGSAPGERVFFEGYNTGTPDAELKPKKKIWEKIQEDMRVNGEGIGVWQDNLMTTKLGIIKCKSIRNTIIK